ncbi:MAG: hypothetical protein RI955_1130 [Bacteroidota bacterium]|jgi:hypothetical protein
MVWQNVTAINRWSYKVKEDPYFDFGYHIGLANYVGDLVPSFYYVNQSKPWNGITARWNYNLHLSVKANLDYGVVSGDDKKSGLSGRYIRNLSFKSAIQELSVMGEANILPFHAYKTKKNFTIYATAGVAIFHFNPKALYNGKWIALQPLGTEGEGIPGYPKKYNRIGISVPFGGGWKFRIKTGRDNYITIGGEICLRKTFTDNLDDVSADKYLPLKFIKKYNGDLAADLSIRADEYYGVPVDYNFDTKRGDKNTKDWYFSSCFTVSYVFRADKTHLVRR